MWKSDLYKGTYIISHYAFKSSDKLTEADHKRVVRNWRMIEEVV